MIKTTIVLEGELNTSLQIFEETALSNIMRTVATSMLGVVKNRIHEEGLAANGTQIGQYNATNPLYVNPLKAPRAFPVKGKTGKVRFKSTGAPHKTRFFESYKAFRQQVGRPVDKVNLSLSGQLNSQFVVIATDKGYGLGWNNEEMPLRARGLEKKYAKVIWGLTENENKLATEIAADELTRLL